MFEFILRQINAIIKQSHIELEGKILKELRSSESLLRADIAILRYQIAQESKNQEKVEFKSSLKS